ncbi:MULTISPECIES: segregation and condensation protein A [Methylococcus]|uniref:Segregation and condensation protein A n=1 Tax=Methylococcus capsulatus TaxID=414 RepID=A0ABZ2F4G4_METCP|nr:MULTISPECIES: segregation/condensation protein A [Methylococcus]MDF9392271.1 segregation/condensation protein A [Methylococcus capsulatus]
MTGTAPAAEALEPVALVKGAPVSQLPEDLYIPPDALEIFLETFEGPLDLLLYLIRKQNLDILDIPIAEISRQYIGYIEMMDSLRIELAAEYLLMAAILAEIKSRVLLPRPKETEAEEEDPRAELVRRLQEYERFKAAAERLDRLPRLERDLFEAGAGSDDIPVPKVYPSIAMNDLLSAFQDVLKRLNHTRHHHIRREALSVRERMSMILERLAGNATLAFETLFPSHEGRPGAVVSLLAVLELSKERLIEIIQDEPLGAVRVRALAVAGGD